MASAGLDIRAKYIFDVPGSGPDHSAVVVNDLLRLTDRPTALVCYNDMIAIGILRGLQQAGLRIPDDISITGFDNIIFSAYTNPALTTLDQPKRFIGAEAARLLLELLDQQPGQELSTEPNVKILKGKLLVRESTAPPGTAS
jgi:DNA-binding LacI/PurR family transcriptional regulator